MLFSFLKVREGRIGRPAFPVSEERSADELIALVPVTAGAVLFSLKTLPPRESR